MLLLFHLKTIFNISLHSFCSDMNCQLWELVLQSLPKHDSNQAVETSERRSEEIRWTCKWFCFLKRLQKYQLFVILQLQNCKGKMFSKAIKVISCEYFLEPSYIDDRFFWLLCLPECSLYVTIANKTSSSVGDGDIHQHHQNPNFILDKFLLLKQL